MKLEEPLDYQTNGLSREFEAYTEGKFASPRINMNVGDVALFKGVLTLKEQRNKDDKKFSIKIHKIILVDNKYDEKLDISEKDIGEIRELSKRDDLFEILCDSISNNLKAFKEIREGILLQIFGGYGNDRDIIHTLIIGDPGIGKSKLIKEISSNIQKIIIIGGAGTTTAGLTAAAVPDELTGGWSIEAGAIVLANNGFLVIDEFDKLSKGAKKALNEPMEFLKFSIAKAGIVQHMQTNTSVIAIANPKNGKWDWYQDLKKQIDMIGSLLSRFDLIYLVEDVIDREKDRIEAMEILLKTEKLKKSYSKELIKKYISYAKENIHPKLSVESAELISEFYTETRDLNKENNDSKPITKRELMALQRLTIARAKLELKEVATVEHAQEAIRIYSNSLKSLRLSPATVGELQNIKSKKEVEILEKIGELHNEFNNGLGYLTTKQKEKIIEIVSREFKENKRRIRLLLNEFMGEKGL